MYIPMHVLVIMITLEKVDSVPFPGPHVHISIHPISGNPTPADLQCNRISVTRSVVPVLI